jgi:hypothetical protein
MPKAVHTYVHHDRKPVCIAETFLPRPDSALELFNFRVSHRDLEWK